MQRNSDRHSQGSQDTQLYGSQWRSRDDEERGGRRGLDEGRFGGDLDHPSSVHALEDRGRREVREIRGGDSDRGSYYRGCDDDDRYEGRMRGEHSLQTQHRDQFGRFGQAEE
nr:hypothetical protein [Deltaproteobacteria bacterium]